MSAITTFEPLQYVVFVLYFLHSHYIRNNKYDFLLLNNILYERLFCSDAASPSVISQVSKQMFKADQTKFTIFIIRLIKKPANEPAFFPYIQESQCCA